MSALRALYDLHDGAALRELQGLPANSGVRADVRGMLHAAGTAERLLAEAALPRMAFPADLSGREMCHQRLPHAARRREMIDC